MLAKKYQHSEVEAKWQKFWEEEGIYRFDEDEDGPIYSIDTPPPTVSGAIHIGHVYSYTHAEIIARFWRMRGYRVFYPFGFDDNGLPTERLVERERKIKASDLQREQFNQLCLQTTEKYETKFKELWQSLGFSVDWNLEYSTIDEASQRVSQISFLDLYQKGKIYQAQNPVLWCIECQTSIAQAEIETKELETKFNYLNFKTDCGEDLIIATTRPELLPACVAILIHPDDERYRHLIGDEAIIPLIGERVPIIAEEEVDRTKGSGVVMCCTFGDQQDIIWWKRYQLPLREMIGTDGKIKTQYKPYDGLSFEEAREIIIGDLKKEGYLIKQESLTHQVAHHERCGQPIEYHTSRQWFIKVMDEKERLIKVADEINWHPAFMKYRYLEWVQNLEWDWCISRQRYFGVPFPVWYCAQCGKIIVADFEQLPVNPLKDQPVSRCNCGSTDVVPEQDVMDTWATSSVTPQINACWRGGEEFTFEIKPMSLRPQAHEIIRTWAFYTIVKSLYHFNQIPWKDIMISGYVMASRGEKISKSKANSQYTPEELIEKFSADVIRLWTSQAKLGTDIYFVGDEVRNNQRIPIKLWNAARFVLSHLEDFSGIEQREYELMDQWILIQMQKTHEAMTKSLEAYELSQAKAILEKFFWNDFCDNYLEIVKERLYKPELRGDDGRKSAQQTLYMVLLNIIKMYAIFIPHMTEEIYQDYYRVREGVMSIHCLPWNRYTDLNFVQAIASGGEKFIQIASQVRKYKSEQGISLGSELARLKISVGSEDSRDFLLKTQDDLKAVTRAKELIFEKANNELGVTIIDE